MKWTYVKLEELYSVHNGLSKGRKYFGTGHPFLSFSTVFNNYFIPEELNDLVQTNVKEQENYSIKRGDIFVTRTSETSDELGMSCVALKDYPKATYNGFTKRMRPIDENVILPEFIGYYMRLPSFRSKFQAFSTMTTRASLRNEDLLSLKVPVPPMEIQIKIAKTLKNYDDLIKNNKKQIKLLEEATQRLYKEWFIDLKFPGYEDVAIDDGKPVGWEITQIKDVCTKMNAGGTPSRNKSAFWDDATIKWYKTGELQDCWLIDSDEYISEDGLNGSSAKLFPKNTIIMAIYASPTLGRLGILSSEAACNQAALCFIADENKISWQWLYHKLYELRDDFNAVAHGAGQQNISTEMVKNKEIILPSKNLIDRFTVLVNSYFEKRLVLQLQNNLLEQGRNRLLPKLMSGEIEV